ncbi:MAG: glycoside hydrolase family 92 protein [Bacteroidia bacterium]
MRKKWETRSRLRDHYLRSQGWKHLFDQTVGSKNGFMRPRNNGAWLEPFDPFEVNNHYTEANSWQYSFFRSARFKGSSIDVLH